MGSYTNNSYNSFNFQRFEFACFTIPYELMASNSTVQLYLQNRRDNLTIDTTLGIPLDETSYMSIVNGGYHNGDDVASINELKQLLSDTR